MNGFKIRRTLKYSVLLRNDMGDECILNLILCENDSKLTSDQ